MGVLNRINEFTVELRLASNVNDMVLMGIVSIAQGLRVLTKLDKASIQGALNRLKEVYDIHSTESTMPPDTDTEKIFNL